MKRFFVLMMGLMVCIASLSAQYQTATEEQRREFINRVAQVSNEMNTMQCDFTQVRELSLMDDKITSEGKMFFKKTNKIRWEYTTPNQYVISMDGQNIIMTSGGQKRAIPANQNKMFSEISKVLVGGVSASGLVDSPDFDTQFFIGNNDYKVVLSPKKKEIKDLYAAFQLFVGKSDNRIRSVELVEKSGDKTTITLRNIQVNALINDAIFSQ